MYKLIPLSVVALTVYCVYFLSEPFDAETIRGKYVLITGASSGIGEQLAYDYSKFGARVFLIARRGKLLEKVAKRCRDLGAPQVEVFSCDLGEQQDRDMAVAQVKLRFGGLDHLILNHAIISTGLWLGTRENMTMLLHEMNVNFLSFADLASQTLPMLARSKGHIGVVSSIAGKFASVGFASYCTTKHAIQGFFAALRQELQLRNTGISVTTCVIGPVSTDLLKIPKDVRKQRMDKMAPKGLGTMTLVEKLFDMFDKVATPEDTAMAIMRGVTARKDEIYYGRIAWVMVSIHKIFPLVIEEYFGKQSIALFNIGV